ncbi:hypothetical protein [Chlamydiifrater phoenicopteri]|uniref:hypothetical protein n=1 Tax=Chlamydiifrater phoenicopteri TaxID=2681469 RepID=UPI001BCAC477|nr:hypothetical protein [Chlamydiifrater phoenicopteri]
MIKVHYETGCPCGKSHPWTSPRRNPLTIFISFILNLLKQMFLRMKEAWQLVSNRLKVYRADFRTANSTHILFSESPEKVAKAFFKFLYLLS